MEGAGKFWASLPDAASPALALGMLTPISVASDCQHAFGVFQIAAVRSFRAFLQDRYGFGQVHQFGERARHETVQC